MKPDMPPLAFVRPERLALSALVVADHGVGGVQNALGGAVILLQPHHLRLGIHLLKIQDIADIRPPEFVDGLIVIPHHTEISAAGCKQPHQLKLRRVRVLILVHHDIGKTVLVILQNLL